MKKSGPGTETALKAQERRGKGRNNDGATKGKCLNCGKKGHWAKDCWAKGGCKEGRSPKWWRGKKAKSRDKDATKQATDKNDIDFVFTATEHTAIIKDLACRADISASDWLADTRSTTHIARNRDHFIEFILEPSEIRALCQAQPYILKGTALFKWNFRSAIVPLPLDLMTSTMHLPFQTIFSVLVVLWT
jgi:Zinc knuckle